MLSEKQNFSDNIFSFFVFQLVFKLPELPFLVFQPIRRRRL
jgi:hypothetical protein